MGVPSQRTGKLKSSSILGKSEVSATADRYSEKERKESLIPAVLLRTAFAGHTFYPYLLICKMRRVNFYVRQSEFGF